MPTGPLPDSVTVVISEIMYHPVQENADVDNHEYVELFNRSKSAVKLMGWRLESTKGGLAFTFPADATIGPGEYRVVAKNRKMLAAVWTGLKDAQLWGDYDGALENGNESLILKTGDGKVMDTLKFGDGEPWPISADALGVGEDWLPASDRPLMKHQYKGRSLERISTDWDSATPANWEASALDGATPGAPNSVLGKVLPVVEARSASPMGGSGSIIRSKESATIRVKFSPLSAVDQVTVRTFDDDITKTDEPKEDIKMVAGVDSTFEATLKPKADSTIVRYQIWASRGGGPLEQVSPRKTDPDQWHAYFVTPDVKTTSRVYHMFIAPKDWSQLETWLAKGRMQDNCNWNPGWDTDLPVTFVYEGQVYDAMAGYSGSRYQRPNGANIDIKTWPGVGPTVPAGRTFRALSWKVKFPKWKPFEGYRSIKLNKQYQGFPGTVSYVESKLLEKAGVPSYRVRFARLHINGAYYHYTAEMEQIDEKMVERYLDKGEKVGDMFKADGSFSDQGPAYRGDFTPIPASKDCPKYTAADRYAATYPRVTNEYRGPGEIMKLISDLDAASKKGAVSSEVKTYFEANWDVDALAKAFAIRNWAGVWDDTFHNVYPYKRLSTGKWILIQQDFEWDFGVGKLGGEPNFALWRPDVTLYLGAYSNQSIGKTCETTLGPGETDRCNVLGFSRLKDLFIQNFRQKYDDTLRTLVKSGVLSASEVLKVIDDGVAAFNKADWAAAPASKMFCGEGRTKVCNVDENHELMRSWVMGRAALVGARLGM